MFEILIADPAVIAVLGTFGGGIGLKCIEKSLSKKKTKAPAVMSYKESSAAKLDTKPTVWDCEVFEQRQFEKKLVKEKVLTAVETRCENKECPECYPNRPGNGRKEAPEIGTVRHLNDTKRWRAPLPVADPEKIKRLKAEGRKAFNNSKAGKARVAEVSGRVVPIPNNVPRFATGQLVYDSGMLSSFIGWRWHDNDDPNQPLRSYRQNITDEVFDSLPFAGKREPFTTKGGNRMIVCKVCSDTYYVRPDSKMGPVHTFTCKKCQGPPKPPPGKGGGSPSPKNMMDYFKEENEKQKKQLQAEQYKIDEYKKRMYELEHLIKNNFISANEARQKYGTASTGPQ